jgi:hypothetical protein
MQQKGTMKANYSYIQPNRGAYKRVKFDAGYYFMWAVMLVSTLAMLYGVERAVVNHDRQQHLMFCESAKLTGNLTVKGCE